MRKRSRTILFILVVLLFFGLAPTIVLYSQGYRIDWEQRAITQIGIFDIRVRPNAANISINGVYAKRTDRFLGTTRSQELVPGNYHVLIEKEGYHPWEKTLPVRAKQVTKIIDTILFPKESGLKEIRRDVTEAWEISEEQILFTTKNSEKMLVLALWNIRTGITQEIWQAESGQTELYDLVWQENPFRIFVVTTQGETDAQTGELIFPEDRNLCQAQSCTASLSLETQDNVLLSPVQEDQIFFLTTINEQVTLQSLEVFEGQQAQPVNLANAQGSIVAFSINREVFYWLDSAGIVWQQPLNRPSAPSRISQLPDITIPLSFEGRYDIIHTNSHLFVQVENRLFQYDPITREFHSIFDNVKLVQSDLTEKMLVVNGTEIWVYYLTDQLQQPQHAQYEKVFLTRFGSSITSLQWLTPSYIAVGLRDTIVVMETDDRDRINMLNIGNLYRPKLIWSNSTKSLSALPEDAAILYQTDRLIP